MGFVVAERQFARLHSRVRFHSPASLSLSIRYLRRGFCLEIGLVGMKVEVSTLLYLVVINIFLGSFA
jgi:hypothetical protein